MLVPGASRLSIPLRNSSSLSSYVQPSWPSRSSLSSGSLASSTNDHMLVSCRIWYSPEFISSTAILDIRSCDLDMLTPLHDLYFFPDLPLMLILYRTYCRAKVRSQGLGHALPTFERYSRSFGYPTRWSDGKQTRYYESQEDLEEGSEGCEERGYYNYHCPWKCSV